MELGDKGDEQMIDDMSDTVVRLDDWEGERLASHRYCPKCDEDNAYVFIKRDSRRRFIGHCCECDYPVFVIKPKELFSAVRWLRKRRAKRVYVGGGDGAAA
jgi:hypothetical protein